MSALGQKQIMCSAKRHVRFTPDSDHHRVFLTCFRIAGRAMIAAMPRDCAVIFSDLLAALL